MNGKITLLTGYDHFFGQTRKPWVSLNTKALIEDLEKHGIQVTEYPFHKVMNGEIEIREAVVFYTFSQRENLRHYIKDTVYALQNNGNVLIPSYELLHCHENKGYQESQKRALGITNLPSLYFSSKRELEEYVINYPVVLKTIEGSNGKGVFLIKSKEQLLDTIKKLEPKASITTKLDLFRRKYLRLPKKFMGYDLFDSKKDFEQYRDYITPEICFVLQRFVPGLQFDYRVIILGEHYYVTKRLTRKDDFRASGAKRFTFDFQAPEELLTYSKEFFDKFDSPCLSLDIGVKDNEFFLFEFQALHFGINAIVRGKGYYLNSGGNWSFVNHKPVFEKELSHALLTYLHKKKLF